MRLLRALVTRQRRSLCHTGPSETNTDEYGIRMDYRCPACEKDLGTRKLTQAIMVRMEMDCTHCKSKLRFNVHQAEFLIVVFNFAAIIAFFAGAYWYPTDRLATYAFGLAMLGSVMLPLLNRTWLRQWPRFVLLPPSGVPR